MTKLICEEVEYGSNDYQKTLEIRDIVLRQPLGLTFGENQSDDEKGDWHLAVRMGDELVGCLVLTPKQDNSVKMRQVAILDGHRSKGIGGELVQFAEVFCTQKKAETVFCHARETAIPFYRKHGYEIYDEPFEEIGIPHRKMRKYLI